MTSIDDESVRTENARREKEKELSLQESRIREARVAQRLRIIWLIISIVIAILLGGTAAIGVWQSYPVYVGWLGLVAGGLSTLIAISQILGNRPRLHTLGYELLVLQSEQVSLAAQSASDPTAALRIYKVASRDDIDTYRLKATRNRRVHNILQGVIIVGSIVVTSLTSAGLSNTWARIIGASVAGFVSIAAGFTGYFKFRERSFNQQQTADAIEKEAKAVDLRIDPYDCDEGDALRKFASKIEEFKEEQRKRELQLEQSSHPQEQRS